MEVNVLNSNIYSIIYIDNYIHLIMHLFRQPNNHKPFHLERQNKEVSFPQNLKSMKKLIDEWISGLC